jgi:hypothetical protein
VQPATVADVLAALDVATDATAGVRDRAIAEGWGDLHALEAVGLAPPSEYAVVGWLDAFVAPVSESLFVDAVHAEIARRWEEEEAEQDHAA